MKRLIIAALFGMMTLTAQEAKSQVKIGYISIESMVRLMPETAKIDSILEKYQNDSINPQYANLVALYQYKDSVMRDTLRTKEVVRKQIEQEVQGLIYQIQNWQTIAGQALEAKQNELLAPIYTKVYDAIRAVAKEKGYTHVFNKEALLVAPDADDLITAVAAKLKVQLPKPQGK
ncbi:MAG: OmpH family outer membrane protein [Chitinophagaceae bacterium]|nr:OmpH family outer membrane protein [Chitinophagaceae bacterium]